MTHGSRVNARLCLALPAIDTQLFRELCYPLPRQAESVADLRKRELWLIEHGAQLHEPFALHRFVTHRYSSGN